MERKCGDTQPGARSELKFLPDITAPTAIVDLSRPCLLTEWQCRGNEEILEFGAIGAFQSRRR